MRTLLPMLLLVACAGQPGPPPDAPGPAMPPDARPMIIAHRGASALLPEHTLAAYRKAIEDGADAIEPDLVSTRDGVLVSRHENEIGGTTDVADRPEFADRRTRKRVDGERVEGWFTEDFTLAELKTLRARERLPELRSTAHDGRFEIATLDEIIALAAEESNARGRELALVPEIKHPTYFASIGLAMEDRLLATLAAHPYTRRAPVLIQSFETGSLRELRGKIGDAPNIRLLQLLERPSRQPYDLAASGHGTTYGEMQQPQGLRTIAAYADIVSPPIASLRLYRTGNGHRSALVDDAHAVGLQVVPWTFRPENTFLQGRYRGGSRSVRNEAGSIRQIRDHVEAGIDGLFADDPAVARRALDRDPY